MNVQPCKPYHAILDAFRCIEMADGVSFFKVYYISIIGRSEPERYEWKRCGFSFDAAERRLKESGLDGIGFVTAFPHITKVFRFAPEMETILNLKGYDTVSFAPLDLGRSSGWMEFACLAESAIAADEHWAWGQATTVAEYLQFVSGQKEWKIAHPGKFLCYWDTFFGKK